MTRKEIAANYANYANVGVVSVIRGYFYPRNPRLMSWFCFGRIVLFVVTVPQKVDN